MYGHQHTIQIQKSQVSPNINPSTTSNNGANRPSTSFSNKFYKPGEENLAGSGMSNTSAISKQLPYHQKKTLIRGNSNKLPEITNQPGSVKKSDKIGNGSGVYQNNVQNTNNQTAVVSNGNLQSNEFNEIAQNEKDERFRYLLKHGTLRRIELNGNIIFCELPQILGIWVCYRRPVERDANTEKLNLDYMELTHMPLLEGEEKLKILTYQHNKIVKIENLVSLPYLLYLDLYDNQLREIDSLAALLQLRVLLLPKNNITRIQQIDHLSKLEVLDLHSNKISKIEGIKSLVNLKILNLANNLIVKLENLESQINLVELNLKLNLIEKIEGITHIQKLEKLFLQNNRIDSLEGIKCLKNIPSLLELNLDGNPLSKNLLQPTYQKFVLANTINLKTLDHKLVDLIKEDLKKEQLSQQSTEIEDKNVKINYLNNQNNGSNGNISTQQSMKQQDKSEQHNNQFDPDQDDEDINPEEVISIIGEQWKLELSRVKQLELQNAKKKDYMQNILVEGGHAEIEDDSSLFIYGNAYEIVLCNEQFQDVIEKIQFQYILFDFIIENTNLVTLKNFKKLKEIVFKDNYLVTLLQLAKLEILPSLRSISLSNNPLQKCSFLKEFIVYRFPMISRINGIDVKESDKLKAKNLFSNFDRILQLPEKFYNSQTIRPYPSQNTEESLSHDKQFMKVYSKVAADSADAFSNNLFNGMVQEKKIEEDFDGIFDKYIFNLIEQSEIFKPQQNSSQKRIDSNKRNPSPMPYRSYV